MLDYKDNYILNKLITANQALTILDISLLLGISQRSVYYSIARINEYLESRNLPQLNSKRREGVKIDAFAKEQLKIDFSESLEFEYLYTQQERNAIQILMILCFDEIINISYFAEKFSLSRNTIVSDIKEARKKISIYNLALEFDSNQGYIIEGSPLRKRSVILNLISKYEYLLKINSYNLFSEKDFKTAYDKFIMLENIVRIRYVHSTIRYLAILVAIIKKKQLEVVKFAPLDESMLIKSKEYRAVKEAFKTYITADELLYLTLHLLGIRVQTPLELENFEDDYAAETVNYLISEFSKSTLIYFDNQGQLFKDLYLHMKQALFRFKYGIIFENEIKDSIFKNYPQVTHVTKTICSKLEERIGYPISDDDVAYIATHFGAHLKREKRELKRWKVILVCLNGVATSKLLKKELDSLVSNIEIINVVRVEEVEGFKNKVDFIISTVPIKCESANPKFLQINPILTKDDKIKILSLFGEKKVNHNQKYLAKLIYGDIEEYIVENKTKLVKSKIQQRIRQEIKELSIYEKGLRVMLKDLIDESRIIFRDSVSNWEESIELSALPLLKAGDIEKKYVEKVIQNVKELGPYIVVAPNFVISHARPEAGVNRLAMSLLVLQKPVNFSETKDRKARVIVTLAAPDGEKHLLALQQLSTLLVEAGDKLLEVKSTEEVLTLINHYSQKEY